MKNVRYELQSHRGYLVEVPEEYAKVAQEIVDKGVKGSEIRDDAKPLAIQLFENIGILSAYGRLAESVQFRREGQPLSKDALKYQDEVYLRIVQKLNEQKLRSNERPEALSIDQGLIKAIHSLNNIP